jgi:DNA-directed RNA polymerase specialized sigma24 family protein
MDEPINRLNLSRLADRCSLELVKRRRKEAADDSYCLEIFRRAILERDDEAWSILQGCFSENVRIWIRSHANSNLALLRDSEENYVAQTFSRFWVAVHEQHSEFRTLNGALSYLHATLDGIFRDMMRSHRRSQEVPLPEQDSPEEPAAEQPDDDLDVWNTLLGLLNNERERRVVQLLYYHGLTPKKIVKHFPQEFSNEKEIYRVNYNIVERLQRKREQLRWLFSR